MLQIVIYKTQFLGRIYTPALMSTKLLYAGTWMTWEKSLTTSYTSCLTRLDHLCVLILVI